MTIGSYNCSLVEFETTLAKLNKNELINFVPEFCLSCGKSNRENQNCWTFVHDAFQYFIREGKVIQEKMKTFSSQLHKIIAINKKKIIKNIKKELRLNENCETVEIRLYQKRDFELGLVLKMGEKEFSKDVSRSEAHHEGSVELKSFFQSNARLRSTATSLNKRELADILELTYVSLKTTTRRILSQQIL